MSGQVELSTPIGLIRRSEFVPGATIDELVEAHDIPVGRQPTVCVLNGAPVLRKDWGRPVSAEDTVIFIAMPLGQEGGLKGILRLVALIALSVVAPYAAGVIGGALNVTSQIGLGLIQAGVMVAGAFLINALLAPKIPEAKSSEASPTYNLGAQGNQARLMQPIPRLYGRHLIYPDFASTPFADYENNEQYVYQLFCLGVGEYDVERVRIEETDVWTAEDGFTNNFDDVQIELVPPGSTVTLIPLEVVTSSEVGGQELKNVTLSGTYQFSGTTITRTSGDHFEHLVPGDTIVISGSGANNGTRTVNTIAGDNLSLTVAGAAFSALTGAKTIELDNWVGPFVAVDADKAADRLALDFVLPQGLGYANDGGGISSLSVSLEVQARPIDVAGAPTGDWAIIGSHTYLRQTSTPQRITQSYDMTPGRYEVRVRRTTPKNFSNRYLNVLQWGSLRAYIPDDATFDDVTLLAVKMRATDQLTQQSSRKFNTIQTAKVPIWDGTSWSIPTASRSIAWAAADMLRNEVYGHGLQDGRIDLPKLLQLAETWETRGDHFDGVFDTKQSLWEALGQVLRAGRTQPVMVAGVVTFVRDEPRLLARGVFTPGNIVKNSFESTHVLYDENAPDDVIVEFIDQRTWKQNEVQCTLPGSLSEQPARISLFGVTDRTQAWREGMYQAACNAYRRTFAKLSTELDGRLLIKGDPLVVSHDVPKWASSGDVLALYASDRVLELSEPVEAAGGTADNYIVLRRSNGGEFGPIMCEVLDPYTVRLDADDLAAASSATGETLSQVVSTSTDRDPTRYIFGADSGQSVLRRFLLASGTPRGLEQVELTMVNDDPRVHEADAGTPPEEVAPVGPGATPGAPVATNLSVVQDPNSASNPVTVNASWPAAAGALSYVLQVSYDNVGWSTVYSGAGTSTQLTLQAGTLYFRLAAVNQFRGPWALFSGSFGTATSDPSTPTNLLVSASLSAGTIEMSWTGGARVKQYRVQLYVETTPGSGVYDLLKITRTTVATAYLLTASDVTAVGGPWPAFQVQVSSVNDTGTSSPAVFTATGIGLDAPQGLAAATNYRGRSLSVIWSAVGGATQYDVEVSARGEVLDTIVVASPSITIAEDQLADYGGPWYSLSVRVRARSSTLTSGYSSPLTVRMPGLTNLWLFDDAAGTADSAGSGTLTLTGATASAAAARYGSGKGWRGTANTDKATTSALLGTSYTKAAWIKPTNLTGQRSIVSSVASTSTPDAFHLFRLNADALQAGHGAVTVALAHTGGLAAGVWAHVAVTYDAPTTTMRLYIDGVQVASSSSVAAIPAGAGIVVGNYASSAIIGFIGDMDDVQVYNRALTATEVKALLK